MLFEQISKDMAEAMKARDKVRLMALRNAKKYFLEAMTAPGADARLSDEQALKIISKLVKQGRDTAQLYTEKNRPELAEEEMGQVRALEAYLPKALSAEELEAELRAIIAETGATGARDMGKVMGVASKKLAGRAEGKAISAKVKELLA